MKSRTRIAIVGAGVTGLSTAYSLVGRGVSDIVIVEKGHLASGASTRNGGGVRAQFTTAENILLTRWSIDRFRKLSAELNTNFWFRQGGYLIIAESAEELDTLDKAVEYHREFGLGTRIVDCDAVQRLAPEMVCSTVKGGAFRKGDGGLFPFPLLFGYAELLRQEGVSIETHCDVTGIARSGDGYAIETTRGTIDADVVLNAAGGWSSQIAEMLGVQLPTMPVRHQIMVSEPLAPFLDPMVVTLRGGFYMSQGMRGELVAGITESGPHGDDIKKASAEFCRLVSRRIVGLFPRLSAARMMRQWAGFYDMSPDANPILDELPGLDGAFVACGFSGHGFMISPAVGEFMASLMLRENPRFPREPYSLARFEQEVKRKEVFVIG